MWYKNQVIEPNENSRGGRAVLMEMEPPRVGDKLQARMDWGYEELAYLRPRALAAQAEKPRGGQSNPQGGLLKSNPGVGGKRAGAGETTNHFQDLAPKLIRWLSAYLKDERERYRPQGRSLTEEERAVFQPFFSQELLKQVRVVTLSGERLDNPPFYPEAMRLGLTHLPDMMHKASSTFLDVIVFNEAITVRALFHALVHAAQIHVLGERFFSELFARQLLRTPSYSLAPMKAQAFALDARFAAERGRVFSVEAEVRSWLDAGRY